MLQMLAQHTPSLALSNIKRFAELIHSYQVITTSQSIMFAMGFVHMA